MILSLQDARKYLGRISSLPTLLILVWLWAIWWGERWTFNSSLRSCQWHEWERWPLGASAHHVVLIADPQLVDPHTYPGRPWPLSALTVFYTDLYLRRSYRLLQQHLEPDTLFFLGDLFDGGREWGTGSYKSPEKRYHKYGDQFWRKEYNRFVNIFMRGWRRGSQGSLEEPRGGKIISSLPGNHDLGFATGIHPTVRDRFDTYFGPLNRIDVVGNHTFVSLDTVSLSAMDQIDPVTGSSGLGDGTGVPTATSGIWRPVEQFLGQAKDAKAHAIQREYRILSGSSEAVYFQGGLPALEPNVSALRDAPAIHQKTSSAIPAMFPTILLSHVPLYRPAGTSCGPFRERGDALSIAAGYQYQNVLTPLISKALISNLGASEVAQIYSGDDHDYCEMEHLEFTGRIKEITVKSMSWAMGVRRPGFLAVSLHNPIDLSPLPYTDAVSPKDTIQNHLCLLPDQLAIFIRYAQLLALTLIVLAVRAVLYKQPLHSTLSLKPPSMPLLPLSEPKTTHQPNRERSYSSSQSTSLLSANNIISTRSAGPRRYSPPSDSARGGYGNLPASSRSSSPIKKEAFPPMSASHSHSLSGEDEWSTKTTHQQRRRTTAGKLRGFRLSVIQVSLPVLVFYLWALWNE